MITWTRRLHTWHRFLHFQLRLLYLASCPRPLLLPQLMWPAHPINLRPNHLFQRPTPHQQPIMLTYQIFQTSERHKRTVHWPRFSSPRLPGKYHLLRMYFRVYPCIPLHHTLNHLPCPHRPCLISLPQNICTRIILQVRPNIRYQVLLSLVHRRLDNILCRLGLARMWCQIWDKMHLHPPALVAISVMRITTFKKVVLIQVPLV